MCTPASWCGWPARRSARRSSLWASYRHEQGSDHPAGGGPGPYARVDGRSPVRSRCLWGSRGTSDSFDIVERRATVAATGTLVDGQAVIDIPITPALVRKARPLGLLHTFCCDISIRRPGTPDAPGPLLFVAGGGEMEAVADHDLPRRRLPPGHEARHRRHRHPVLGRPARGGHAVDHVRQERRRHHVVAPARVTDAYQRWLGRAPTRAASSTGPPGWPRTPPPTSTSPSA